jgi:signal transduction histidine kinase
LALNYKDARKKGESTMKPLQKAAIDGLAFFGQVSASISHELKNTISIMNESAGLLEDLSGMADKGIPIDTAKVKRLSATIKHQITRTNDIIRNMNRFAHLVDEPYRQIDVADCLKLVIAVSNRFIASAGVEITTDGSRPSTIVTRPFYLHHLIWLLIKHCIDVTGIKGSLAIESKQVEKSGACILFSGLASIASEQQFAENALENLLSILEARLETDFTKNTLCLFLPETIDDQTAENGLPQS